MNADLLLVLSLLVACIGLFIIDKPRMDVVALSVIVILPLTGIIVSEALAGFSDTNVLLIAALFVIGEGLTRTGIAYRLSDPLISMAGSSGARLLVLLMMAVAGLGSVMSSTGVVAIFLPVALTLAARLDVLPGRLMMPLAYAGLISGMLTLVGTAPNMVVDGALRDHGFVGFNFFSFTPFGAAVLIIGVAYMLAARRWLGVGKREKPQQGRRCNLVDLIRDFRLSGREYRLRIRADSPLVGCTLRELQEPSARAQTEGTGRRLSLARMASAGLVQTKGLGSSLCALR
jgi:di/tricarboxylate transporter